jgi:hypothetical protein
MMLVEERKLDKKGRKEAENILNHPDRKYL